MAIPPCYLPSSGALFQALPPQSSIFLVWLEKTEAMVTTLRLYEDDVRQPPAPFWTIFSHVFLSSL